MGVSLHLSELDNYPNFDLANESTIQYSYVPRNTEDSRSFYVTLTVL